MRGDHFTEYIRLMRQVRTLCRSILSAGGIVVECNPTSNVLIGTFETYEKHPIFRFYDSGLELLQTGSFLPPDGGVRQHR